MLLINLIVHALYFIVHFKVKNKTENFENFLAFISAFPKSFGQLGVPVLAMVFCHPSILLFLISTSFIKLSVFFKHSVSLCSITQGCNFSRILYNQGETGKLDITDTFSLLYDTFYPNFHLFSLNETKFIIWGKN